MLATTRSNLDIYRAAARSYLDEAAYIRVNRKFNGQKGFAAVLAIVAAVGALGFQLSLASKKADAPAAEPAPPPGVSYLSKLPTPASTVLWDALGLARCANASGEVPVLRQQGAGSAADPTS